jgi:hypothetical protein
MGVIFMAQQWRKRFCAMMKVALREKAWRKLRRHACFRSSATMAHGAEEFACCRWTMQFKVERSAQKFFCQGCLKLSPKFLLEIISLLHGKQVCSVNSAIRRGEFGRNASKR